MRRRTKRTALLFLIPGAAYFLAVFAYPIARTVQMSLYQVNATDFVTGGWKFIGLGNYSALLHLQATSQTLINSAIFLVCSIIFQFVISMFLAVALRRPTLGRRILRTIVLTPWLLPSVTVAAVFLWIFNAQGGLANYVLGHIGLEHHPIQWFAGSGTALGVIILVNIWIGIPFNFLVLQSGLQAVDGDLHEAAVVDGAGWWKELLRITLPIMRESVFMVLMLGVIGTLKVFDYVWIMTQGGPANATMLPGPLAYSESFIQFNYGRGAAVVLVVVVAMLVLTALYLYMTGRGERRQRRADARLRLAPAAHQAAAGAPPPAKQPAGRQAASVSEGRS
jgi:multiple sugar transport system permease protein